MNYNKAKFVKIPFGKYNGQRLVDILFDDPAYLDYIMDYDLSRYPDFRKAFEEFIRSKFVQREIDKTVL